MRSGAARRRPRAGRPRTGAAGTPDAVQPVRDALALCVARLRVASRHEAIRNRRGEAGGVALHVLLRPVAVAMGAVGREESLRVACPGVCASGAGRPRAARAGAAGTGAARAARGARRRAARARSARAGRGACRPRVAVPRSGGAAGQRAQGQADENPPTKRRNGGHSLHECRSGATALRGETRCCGRCAAAGPRNFDGWVRVAGASMLTAPATPCCTCSIVPAWSPGRPPGRPAAFRRCRATSGSSRGRGPGSGRGRRPEWPKARRAGARS